ncbi:MAG: DUF6082 family protein [Streptosporangiaceae bacterium]
MRSNYLMGGWYMVISLISILISSIALVGVAASLLLQNRQLRISQLQATRAMQAILIQMSLSSPTLAAGAFGFSDAERMGKGALVNWQVRHWEASHSIKAMSDESVRVESAHLFTSEFAREWWAEVREVYRVDAKTKLERRFCTIVDTEFERKRREFEAPPPS